VFSSNGGLETRHPDALTSGASMSSNPSLADEARTALPEALRDQGGRPSSSENQGLYLILAWDFSEFKTVPRPDPPPFANWTVDDPPTEADIDRAVDAVFASRVHAPIFRRLVAIQIESAEQANEIFGAMEYIATALFPNLMGYALSPATLADDHWLGRIGGAWPDVNRVTASRILKSPSVSPSPSVPPSASPSPSQPPEDDA
jgi:hypothetical protein